MVKPKRSSIWLLLCPAILIWSLAPPMQTEESVAGARQLARTILRKHPYLIAGVQRSELDEVLRRLRESQSRMDDTGAALKKLGEILETSAFVLPVRIDGLSVRTSRSEPISLPGDTGAVLLEVDSLDGETHYQTITDYDPAVSGKPVQVELPETGKTWVLIDMIHIPVNRSHLLVELSRAGHLVGWVPLDIETPQRGRLKVQILSAESGRPVPAMVSLVSKVDGRARPPSNAVNLAAQFEGRGRPTSERMGKFPWGRESYWCVPGPFDMSLPPGEWEIRIRRGIEHIPIVDRITIESAETSERTYRPERWVDMAKQGWYAGDDHVHARMTSSSDARNLLTWVAAEDLHLANIAKMGDIYMTWFEQRGFGPESRIIDGDRVLSPGQECPRTKELGHTVSMNTRQMVRNPDKYYLYDWVFDRVHAQGGLTGYAHVSYRGIFQVYRDMTLNVPQGKADFASIMQAAQMSVDLYYDFLNLGFKLTASAGSDVPWGGTVGEVRVYSYTEARPFTADGWFDGMRRGRTFVTNGPMIDLRVDDSLPGDELRVDRADQTLRVRARVWGHRDRLLPTKLEIVQHGKVIQSLQPSSHQQAELSVDFKLPAANGFWIAARAEASDGSLAHTTPVYVMRAPLRFWHYPDVSRLVQKRLESLKEIEEVVADAQERADQDPPAGRAPTTPFGLYRPIRELAAQGPELLERVVKARKIYEQLLQTAEKEQTLR